MSSKRLKALLLLLLLGMPVLLYLFLQGFGENQYQIPIFYQDGIISPIHGCSENLTPHSIDGFINEGPCSIWDCSQVNEKLIVFSLVGSECTNSVISEIARICNVFQDQPFFHAVSVSMSPNFSDDLIKTNAELYSLPKELWSLWSYHQAVNPLVKCGLNLDTNCQSAEQVVLVDNKYQIRGYYDATDPQEMDRLITEFKILLAEMK
ncbi:MAG: hypothetical protein ACR2MT_00145 [Aurantibacter sp.]